jgi:hypothetical protein
MSPAVTSPPPWMHGGLWPARSRAELSFCLGERRDVQRTTRQLFGKPLRRWQYAGLAGAPDDARVELGTYRDALSLEMTDPITNRYRALLYVRRAGPALVVVKAGFQIHYRAMQRQGLGLQIFHRQLENAKALGVAWIEAVAGRRHDENGYYTWPRFGFDGPLPGRIRGSLPQDLQHARIVLDLMECEQGRRWWQQHGCTIRVAFDLTDGSRSHTVFQRYVQEKLRYGAETVASQKMIPVTARNGAVSVG